MNAPTNLRFKPARPPALLEVDELIQESEHELREQEVRNLLQAGRREGYEREREKRLREWRELEREMGN